MAKQGCRRLVAAFYRLQTAVLSQAECRAPALTSALPVIYENELGELIAGIATTGLPASYSVEVCASCIVQESGFLCLPTWRLKAPAKSCAR